jgi:hypothetical protein
MESEARRGAEPARDPVDPATRRPGAAEPEAPAPATAPARPGRAPDERASPERARHPVPGVKHEPEPDAGNIMPAEHEPGTL